MTECGNGNADHYELSWQGCFLLFAFAMCLLMKVEMSVARAILKLIFQHCHSTEEATFFQGHLVEIVCYILSKHPPLLEEYFYCSEVQNFWLPPLYFYLGCELDTFRKIYAIYSENRHDLLFRTDYATSLILRAEEYATADVLYFLGGQLPFQQLLVSSAPSPIELASLNRFRQRRVLPGLFPGFVLSDLKRNWDAMRAGPVTVDQLEAYLEKCISYVLLYLNYLDAEVSSYLIREYMCIAQRDRQWTLHPGKWFHIPYHILNKNIIIRHSELLVQLDLISIDFGGDCGSLENLELLLTEFTYPATRIIGINLSETPQTLTTDNKRYLARAMRLLRNTTIKTLSVQVASEEVDATNDGGTVPFIEALHRSKRDIPETVTIDMRPMISAKERAMQLSTMLFMKQGQYLPVNTTAEIDELVPVYRARYLQDLCLEFVEYAITEDDGNAAAGHIVRTHQHWAILEKLLRKPSLRIFEVRNFVALGPPDTIEPRITSPSARLCQVRDLIISPMTIGNQMTALAILGVISAMPYLQKLVLEFSGPCDGNIVLTEFVESLVKKNYLEELSLSVVQDSDVSCLLDMKQLSMWMVSNTSLCTVHVSEGICSHGNYYDQVQLEAKLNASGKAVFAGNSFSPGIVTGLLGRQQVSEAMERHNPKLAQGSHTLRYCLLRKNPSLWYN